MNMHVLQSVTARAEAQELMSVSKNIISPQNYGPTLGMIQDAIMGMWIMTAKDQMYEKDKAMQLICALRQTKQLPVPAIVKPVPLWTGKQLFSTLLPETFSPTNTAVFLDPRTPSETLYQERREESAEHSNLLSVADGRLLHGRLSKRSLGGSPGGFIDLIARDCSDEVVSFISDTQRLAVAVLQYQSFSTGFGDMVLPHDTAASIAHDFDRVKNTVAASFHPEDEQRAIETLQNAVNRAGARGCNAAAETGDNGLVAMIACGSKGSRINLAAVTSGVGTQRVNGQRVFASGDPAGRTMPCFPRGDHRPPVHGFVSSCYRDGLRPHELFMHVKAGREGLVDTAVRTADTGTMSRRVSKFMEGTISDPRARIVSTTNELIQPLYGGDGYDASKVERVSCSALKMNEDDIRARLRWSARRGKLELPLCEMDWVVHCVQAIRRAQLRHGDTIDTRVTVPVNALRVRRRYNGDVDEVEWISFFDNMVARTIPRDQIRECRSGDNVFMSTPLDPFRLHLLWEIGVVMPRRVMEECFRRLQMARLPAGFPPGIIAGQSSSQLVTQSTLNTFHHTGQAHTLVNSGVTRFIEILNATKDIATPIMTLYPRDPFKQSKNMMENFAQALPYRLLSQVVIETRGPHTIESHLPPFLAVWRRLDPSIEPFLVPGVWCIEYRLRHEIEAVGSALPSSPPTAVAKSIRRYFQGLPVYVIASPFGGDEWTVRLLLRDLSFLGRIHDRDTTQTLAHFAKELLSRVALQGIRGISSAGTQPYTVTDPLTGVAEEEQCVTCAGINFSTVSWMPEIDPTKTIMNSIHDVYQHLGIEAAVVALFREGSAVIGKDSISHRHFYLVIDAMTHHGFVNAVNRHGMSKGKAFSPLQRASFEEALDVLMEAAVYNANSKVLGVTECVVLGAPTRVGTGVATIVYPDSEDRLEPADGIEAPQVPEDLKKTGMFKFVGRRRTRIHARPLQEAQNTDTAPVIPPGGTLLVQSQHIEQTTRRSPPRKFEVHFQCHELFTMQIDEEGRGNWQTVFDIGKEQKLHVRTWFETSVRNETVRVQLVITHKCVTGLIKTNEKTVKLARSAHSHSNIIDLIGQHRVRIECGNLGASASNEPRSQRSAALGGKRVWVETFLAHG